MFWPLNNLSPTINLATIRSVSGTGAKQGGCSSATNKSELNNEHSCKSTNHSLQFRNGGSAANLCIPKPTHLSCKVEWFKPQDCQGGTQLRCLGGLGMFLIIDWLIEKICGEVKLNIDKTTLNVVGGNVGLNDFRIHYYVLDPMIGNYGSQSWRF